MKRSIALILAAVMAVSVFSGCGESAETTESAASTPEVTIEATAAATATPTPTVAATATPTATPTPTEAAVAYTNPFTGLPCDKDLSSLRPYIFMCDNVYSANPHAGSSQSDMVMEMMEEGGITRMMLFFADPSNINKVGPIRSARAYNIYTALGYDAFLTHCGSSDEGDALIASYGLQDLDQITGAFSTDSFYRDEARIASSSSVHSLMAVPSNLVNVAQSFGYRMTHNDGYDTTYGLTFSDNAADQCPGTAHDIRITYNGGKTTNFTYNDAEGTYAMYQHDGMEYVDEDGTKVPFSNVIMIYANTYLQSDGQHITIELTSGEGYYFTKGKAAHINWYKNGEYDVFHYTLDDGTPLSLNTGRTFVSVNQCGSYQGSCDFS